MLSLKREQNLNESNKLNVIEIIRSLTEGLVWAEQNKLDFFK